MTRLSSPSWLGRALPLLLACAVSLGLVGVAQQDATPVKVSTVTVFIPIEVWTNVNSGSPGTSYWTSQRDAIRVGKLPDTGAVYRAFMQADVTSLQGRAILSASVQLVLDHSAACSETPVQLWDVAGSYYPNTAVTWINTGSAWRQPVSTAYAAANEPVCNQPDRAVTFDGQALAIALGTAVNAGHPVFAMGLRASDESNWYQWKKFSPAQKYLIVTYSD